MLLCWKMFYRVKAEGGPLKPSSSPEVPIRSSSPTGKVFNGTEHTLEHLFCCLAWPSKCNQDGFGLPHLMCQDTETMSLNSSCMGAPDQEGCHLGRIHCKLRHDTSLPYCRSPQHERWPCLHEVCSAVCPSWRNKLERKVMVWWPSPGPRAYVSS